jgi:hypothetical protein
LVFRRAATSVKAGIPYAATFESIAEVRDYRIIGWSLSSGGALRRPGGG